MATIDAKIGVERENPPIPRPARTGRGNRASVDELNFSHRFEDTVLELTLVKARFRLGPKAHINLAGHIGEVGDRVRCWTRGNRTGLTLKLVSSSKGLYSAQSLPVGRYSISVSAP
jgi:hypothetical protein